MIRVLRTRSGEGADALSGRSSTGEAVAGSAFGKSLREKVRSVGVDGVAIGS